MISQWAKEEKRSFTEPRETKASTKIFYSFKNNFREWHRQEARVGTSRPCPPPEMVVLMTAHTQEDQCRSRGSRLELSALFKLKTITAAAWTGLKHRAARWGKDRRAQG